MNATTETLEPLKIAAVVVQSNGQEFYVLNRRPKFLYEREGRDLIATDGPLAAVYRYEEPCGRFKAFAGREFDIPMLDGSTIKASGQYWDAGLKGFVSIAWATEELLRSCYVFYGGTLANPDALTAMREEYTGGVYPYWDYEKVLKYDEMQKRSWRRVSELERALRHVKRNAKGLKARLRAAEGGAA